MFGEGGGGGVCVWGELLGFYEGWGRGVPRARATPAHVWGDAMWVLGRGEGVCGGLGRA